MAGILCVWDREGTVSERTVERALAAMDYRGPDGSRRVGVDDVHLGHQHFAVTPQSTAGEQPVREGDVWLALDGRVDNRRSLVGDLPDADDDDSDASLLLAAYRAHGEAFVEHVVGAFGVVVYDAAERRLVVARDRVGRREVIYGRAGGATVVASDRTPVVRCREAAGRVAAGRDVAGRDAAGRRRESVEERRLAEYLAFHTFTPGLTVYEGLRAVPPGHYAVVEDGAVDLRRYWRPGGEDTTAPESTLVERLSERCRAAVGAVLRTAGPVGAELSGGKDSTTVAAVAADLLDDEATASGSVAPGPGDLAAYSLVFEAVGDADLRRGERRRIADLASRHDLPREEVVADDLWPRPDAPVYDVVPLEGTCRNATAVAFRELYGRVAGDGRRVLLSGEGGNVFDGTQSAYVDLLRQGRVLAAARGMLRDATPTRRLAWFVALRLAQGVGGRYPSSRTFDRDAVLSASLRAAAERPREEWPAYPQAHYDRLVTRTIDRRQFHSHYLELLAFDRRIALASGVDLRCPMLDPRLVDLAYSLPVEHLFRNGEPKRLFGKFAARYLPESVRAATRTLSFTPLVSRGLVESRERVEALLGGSELAARGYVDDGTLAAVVEELYGRPAAERYHDPDAVSDSDVWRLLAAEGWLRDAGDAGVLG